MNFNFEIKDQVGIYALEGNLIGEHDGINITDSFSEQILQGTKNYLIDLSDLKHINSSGLGVLITLLTKARKEGGDLILANPSSYIKNLMVITKLDTIFEIFESAEEGIARFKE